MAISVSWGTKLVTVNQTDPEMTWVTGDTYELDTNAFRLALKALEDDEEGMAHLRITKHNTIVTIDGVNYVRSFEVINGYTVQFLPDSSWRARMDGASNNNIHSEGILVQNQVQVIPSNSAGNVVTQTGTSGLTAAESQALLDIDTNVSALDTKVDTLLAAQNLTNAQKAAEHTTDSNLGKIILRNTVTSERWEADAWEDTAQTIPYSGGGLESVGQLTSVAWS